MSYNVIKGNNFENFSEIWQHWAGDPLQGVFGSYERYRFSTKLNIEKGTRILRALILFRIIHLKIKIKISIHLEIKN